MGLRESGSPDKAGSLLFVRDSDLQSEFPKHLAKSTLNQHLLEWLYRRLRCCRDGAGVRYEFLKGADPCGRIFNCDPRTVFRFKVVRLACNVFKLLGDTPPVFEEYMPYKSHGSVRDHYVAMVISRWSAPTACGYLYGHWFRNCRHPMSPLDQCDDYFRQTYRISNHP